MTKSTKYKSQAIKSGLKAETGKYANITLIQVASNTNQIVNVNPQTPTKEAAANSSKKWYHNMLSYLKMPMQAWQKDKHIFGVHFLVSLISSLFINMCQASFLVTTKEVFSNFFNKHAQNFPSCRALKDSNIFFCTDSYQQKELTDLASKEFNSFLYDEFKQNALSYAAAGIGMGILFGTFAVKINSATKNLNSDNQPASTTTLSSRN